MVPPKVLRSEVDALFDESPTPSPSQISAQLAHAYASHREDTVALLLVQLQPLAPDMTCEALLDFFTKEHPQVHTLPVVQDGLPLGLVTRYDIVDRFSRLYFRELYGKKSIVEVMNQRPLVVEQDLSLDQLGELMSKEGNHILSDGFIITQRGAYLGMGTGQALIRELTQRKQADLARALQRATDQLLEAQKEVLEKHRMEKELSVAREIQTALLPTRTPTVPGYSISSFYQPAQQVGGDYFDFLPLGGGLLGLTIADVAGKGVPGSLGMTLARTVLRTQASPGLGPAETLRRTNAILQQDLRPGMFITLFYAILDPRRNTLRCACGGHTPAYHLGRTHGIRTVAPEGMALGLGSAASYFVSEEEVDLAPGDLFALYTDGITEAMNPQEEEYGDPRLLHALARHGHGPFPTLSQRLVADLAAFTGAAPQTDDITLVLVRRDD